MLVLRLQVRGVAGRRAADAYKEGRRVLGPRGRIVSKRLLHDLKREKNRPKSISREQTGDET